MRKCLSDSNPSLSDSNPFSSSQIVLKRFESLFQGFESPCPLKRETLQLLKNPTAPFIFSKSFLSIFIPNCFKSVPNSKFLQNPLSYPFHIIILHHSIIKNTQISHESSTTQRDKHQTHRHWDNEGSRQRTIFQILTIKTIS